MSWASASGRIIARAVSVPDLVMRTAGYDGATEAFVQQSAAVPTSGRALAVCWPRFVTGAPEGPLDWFSRSWRRGRSGTAVLTERRVAAYASPVSTCAQKGLPNISN